MTTDSGDKAPSYFSRFCHADSTLGDAMDYRIMWITRKASIPDKVDSGSVWILRRTSLFNVDDAEVPFY